MPNNLPKRKLNSRTAPSIPALAQASPMTGSHTERGDSGPPRPGKSDDLLTALTKGSDSLVSAAPLVEASGDIAEVWPDDCDNKLPDLKEGQEREIDSFFQRDTISISFSEATERRRDHSNMLPPKLYRTHYETSKTLSCYVDKHTHPAHRLTPNLQLDTENAFQSIGSFSLPEDLTREHIERHLVWNRKREPTTFISTFNDLTRAIWRAEFHYNESQRIGMRVFVAEITTVGLVAATVKGRIQTTVKVTTKTKEKRTLLADITEQSATKVRDVTIPVWIRATAIPKDWSAIDHQQYLASGADMWMSITELRRSDLKKHTPKLRSIDTVCAKGHDYEWLACGFIPRSAILRVMPYDGKVLHKTQDTRIVRSIRSPDPWVWDWRQSIWRLDPRMYRTAWFLEIYGGNKYKHVAESATKRSRLQKTSKKQKELRDENPYTSTPNTIGSHEETVWCTKCGQKKTAFRLDHELHGPLAYLDLAPTPSKRVLS